MAIAVEAEPATVGPSIAYGPEHSFEVQLVEAILSIDEEYGCL
jgi:hypothetical protein